MKAIVVGIDLSDDSYRIAQFASDLATKLNLELHLVHIISPIPMTASTFPDPLGNLEPLSVTNDFELVEAQKKAANQYLDKMESELNHSNTFKIILVGDVENEMFNYATEVSAYLIAIGEHSHRGFAGLFDTNTSKSMIADSKIPILIVP